MTTPNATAQTTTIPANTATNTPAAAAPDALATPQTKPTDEMSAKFAALAKKERIGRLAQHNLKQKEQALLKRQQEIEERERVWLDEFKTAPLEALKKRGYSYEELTKAALNDGKFDPEVKIREVEGRLERIQREQAEKEKKLLEDQQTATQKAETEAIDRFKSQIGESIEANKEKYELTSLYDAGELVFQTVEEHYERTAKLGKPKILSIDEACDLVEKYLESEVDRMATTSKKFQAKYATNKPKDADKTTAKSSTTLSNDLNTSAAPSLLSAATENDRLKRALAALG